jgi:LysR family nod box-dependent transcriptional activator
MHRRLAEQIVGSLPLVMREIPFDFPPIREALQWHISNTNDRALRWVVERLQLIAASKAADRSGNVVSLKAAPIDRHALEVEYRMHHPQ